MGAHSNIGVDVRIHPTALIEYGVHVGAGTTIWDNVHIRHNTVIGAGTIVGEKSYIAYGVKIGSKVKINAFVYICTQVIIEDWVMVAAGTIFTNDRFPRAVDPATGERMPSEPTDETLTTVVHRGVTIGANSTIGPGVEIGEFAMVGMGAVVTRMVSPYALMIGNPARCHGYVCQCGKIIYRNRSRSGQISLPTPIVCETCQKSYQVNASYELRPIA